MKRVLISHFLLNALICYGQSAIYSGPMNGYSEMREVQVWVQLSHFGTVELVYWKDSLPGKVLHSQPVVAEASTAYTVHLVADSVEPGNIYGYDIYLDGKNQSANRNLHFKTQSLWRWRHDALVSTIALGSCAFVNEEKYDRPGTSYGNGYEIFESIADKKTDIMLWLGDNTYLREADYFSESGILQRYTHTRHLPELQRLLHSTQHYAIWDDHDYGPNDSNRGFPLKENTLRAFKLFWANNTYGVSDLGGITSAFQYNDLHFYLLDNRWNRSEPNMRTAPEQVLGQRQIDWLIESLKYSRAPFKFVAVGGQILNDAKVYETYANFEQERNMLLDRIAKEKIENVFFLSGDRHHTELSSVTVEGVTIYDLTVSPLTSGTHEPGDEKHNNRIQGTLVNERNFGILKVEGPFERRILQIQIFGASGDLIWQRTIESKTYISGQ